MFGIPVRENASDLQSTVSVFSGRADVLCHTALIVWEEFPMANKAAIECAEHLLRQIMKNDLPFGGKTFLALGDFRQVAPTCHCSCRGLRQLHPILFAMETFSRPTTHATNSKRCGSYLRGMGRSSRRRRTSFQRHHFLATSLSCPFSRKGGRLIVPRPCSC
jgi:hypothetical protein